MIVIALLPKSCTVSFLKIKGRPKFEDAHEFQEIACGIRALHQQVNVIGHEAKRMEQEGMLFGALFKGGKNGMCCGAFVQIGSALITTDSDKMVALAAIKLRREAGTFAVNGHTRRECIRLDKT